VSAHSVIVRPSSAAARSHAIISHTTAASNAAVRTRQQSAWELDRLVSSASRLPRPRDTQRPHVARLRRRQRRAGTRCGGRHGQRASCRLARDSERVGVAEHQLPLDGEAHGLVDDEPAVGRRLHEVGHGIAGGERQQRSLASAIVINPLSRDP
jgi:hypothetical protein